jgi:hypothetical protein
MKWYIRLTGDKKLLNKLKDYLDTEVAFIKNEGNVFYLYSTYFDILEKDKEVFGVATKLIRLINGAVKLFLDTSRMIGFDGVSSIDKNGTHRNYIFTKGSANIETSFDAKISGMTKNHGANVISKWVKKGYYDKKINLLSELLDEVSSKWFLLYNRAELVKKHLGGWDKISEKGWCEESKIDLFKKTSQNYDAIGPEARHVLNYKEIKNPMPYNEAKALIRNINIKWVKEIMSE